MKTDEIAEDLTKNYLSNININAIVKSNDKYQSDPIKLWDDTYKHFLKLIRSNN